MPCRKAVFTGQQPYVLNIGSKEGEDGPTILILARALNGHMVYSMCYFLLLLQKDPVLPEEV
jgi:hypothetical protein